jgi:Cytochrome bd terminal oxidase subunit II
MEPGSDLTIVWAAIIAFTVFAYVVMDGFDLGIGVLFLGFKEGDERDQAMNASPPSGAATRPGWFSAAATFWRRFPSPTRMRSWRSRAS